jgi:glutamyl-tRNA synthetase
MEYAKQLIARGAAYYCFCTKDRLEQLHEEDATGGYDRHCRDLSPEEVQKNLDAGIPYVIRQKMPLDGVTSYTDMVFGEVSVENKELQDQILMKADGYPTYNFAHVVDDYLMQVTHVVRGSEYVTSTPKYALLYDAFGWERPQYVHLPLLMGKNADGSVSKLSKRHGAVSFEDLVNDGFLPEAIINYIALLGWAPKGENAENEFFTMPELEKAFAIAGVNKSPAVFDFDKLYWFNGEYIKKLSPEKFAELATPFFRSSFPSDVDVAAVLRLLQGRVGKLSEVEEKSGLFRALCDYDVALFENKKNKVTVEGAGELLRAALPALQAVETWDNDTLYATLLQLSERLGCKSGAILWCLRIAVSGMTVTPGGATEIMAAIGKQESLARLSCAIAKYK